MINQAELKSNLSSVHDTIGMAARGDQENGKELAQKVYSLIKKYYPQ